MFKLSAYFGPKKPDLQQMRIAELEAAKIRKFQLNLELDQIRAALSGCNERIERLESEANFTEKARTARMSAV